ncbi:alpha/beta fold hydrolase [Streptomyces sp. NPDC058470]|uniref:alpha/beta fold hydrolase n=1 Tax=Streptomyces sp. NPDC058470 TaxID=3346515 RepID=UPI00364D9935
MPELISYDNGAIWYELRGDGEPLVVLPGGPGMDARYLADLGGLANHRRLVLVDQRAAGRSAAPEDRSTVSFTAQARDVEAVRERLGLERIDVLAHSAGCLIAQEYAAAHPERVRRSVLVAPVGRAGREPDAAELAALRAERADREWYGDAAEADRLITSGGYTGSELRALQRRITPFFWHHWDESRWAEHRPEHATPYPWLRDAFYASSATPDTLVDRLARLSAVRSPVLVVAGASDGMIGTAPARAVAACYEGARLHVLERSGHRPWVEEPARFVELVAGFLVEDAD